MADNHHIRVYGLEGLSGVEERLALGDGRGGSRDIDHIGTEPLAGDLERGPRSSARLVEEVDHGLSAERGDLLDLPRGDLFHRVGGLQDKKDLLPLQFADRQEVLSLQRHLFSTVIGRRSAGSGFRVDGSEFKIHEPSLDLPRDGEPVEP